MTSIINLENLPQLVMEKITSFLDHKQLLAVEQVSRTLKCAVEAHFSTTDLLIIGPLPEIKYNDELSVEDKKCLDGLLKIITRCGLRLRIIQLSSAYQNPFGTSIWNDHSYCKHFITSAEVSNNCPNIEHILVSPNMDIVTILDKDMFRQQNILLDENDALIYANNFKLSTGQTCKLRSIKIPYYKKHSEHSYQRIVDLFSNLEQISMYKLDENFYNFLPQLVGNGLKDLSIIFPVKLRIAKMYTNIWKDLRTVRFGVFVEKEDDIEALNKLQLPKNVELTIIINYVDECFSQLKEDICKSIFKCEIYEKTDDRQITKLKNLQQFNIMNSEQLQVITEGSFPNLKRIRSKISLCNSSNCDNTNMCHSQTFLPQLLIKKGHQLTHIDVIIFCKKSMRVVWKALQHCKAAISIALLWGLDCSPLTVSYEEVEAICQLPDLRHFVFAILQGEDNIRLFCARFREMLQRALKVHTDFQVEYKLFGGHEQFTLFRI